MLDLVAKSIIRAVAKQMDKSEWQVELWLKSLRLKGYTPADAGEDLNGIVIKSNNVDDDPDPDDINNKIIVLY